MSLSAIDMMINPSDNSLCFMISDGSNYSVISLTGGTPTLSYVWRSKDFVDNKKYTIAKITKSDGDVTFKYYLDDVLVLTKTVSNNDEMFRLPAGVKNKKSFSVEASTKIDRIQIAESPKELE